MVQSIYPPRRASRPQRCHRFGGRAILLATLLCGWALVAGCAGKTSPTGPGASAMKGETMTLWSTPASEKLMQACATSFMERWKGVRIVVQAHTPQSLAEQLLHPPAAPRGGDSPPSSAVPLYVTVQELMSASDQNHSSAKGAHTPKTALQQYPLVREAATVVVQSNSLLTSLTVRQLRDLLMEKPIGWATLTGQGLTGQEQASSSVQIYYQSGDPLVESLQHSARGGSLPGSSTTAFAEEDPTEGLANKPAEEEEEEAEEQETFAHPRNELAEQEPPPVRHPVASPQEIIEQVAANPNAVGLLGYADAQAAMDQVRVVPIKLSSAGNGAHAPLILPSVDSVAQQRYPLVYTHYAYSRGYPSAQAEIFLQHCLGSSMQTVRQMAGFANP
ncbi:MAG: hypothetical protein SFZ03_03485 [Candidatus Melainabacteria bacterium]|nr:hypothetical protein [Candidatus Melainabacteria bacterium]